MLIHTVLTEVFANIYRDGLCSTCNPWGWERKLCFKHCVHWFKQHHEEPRSNSATKSNCYGILCKTLYLINLNYRSLVLEYQLCAQCSSSNISRDRLTTVTLLQTSCKEKKPTLLSLRNSLAIWDATHALCKHNVRQWKEDSWNQLQSCKDSDIGINLLPHR